MKALDLSGADFDGDGLKVIAEALGEHEALQRLTLRNCKIGGTPGFPSLVAALQKNESILELDVGNTNLDVVSISRHAVQPGTRISNSLAQALAPLSSPSNVLEPP